MSNSKVINARKFVFKEGSRLNVSADLVGNELDRIYSKNNALIASDVVNESRPEKAPLHPAFEWNDGVAAEEWRTHTARNLIRSVKVVLDNENQAQTAFVNVINETGKRNYQPMEIVIKRPDLYANAVYDVQIRINAALASLNELENLAKNVNVDAMKMATIRIVMKALATANSAAQSLH
jgi:hypothetical protein